MGSIDTSSGVINTIDMQNDNFQQLFYKDWADFSFLISTPLGNILTSSGIQDSDTVKELSDLIIAYLNEQRITIDTITGIGYSGNTLFIHYTNLNDASLHIENIDINSYIDKIGIRELTQVELETYTGEFELLLDTIDSILIENEKEWFYNGGRYLDENDIFEGVGNLQGENIETLSVIAREKWKDMLENISRLTYQIRDEGLKARIDSVQERYMRMSMGIGERNFRAIEVFRRSQEEVNYMINWELASFSSPQEVINYYLEIQENLARYRGETSNTSGMRIQTIFIKTLQVLSYERLQSLEANMNEYTLFAQIMTGREDETGIIPNIQERERNAIDLGGRTLNRVGQDIQELFQNKFFNTQGDLLSGEEVLQSIPQYNTILFEKDSIDNLSLEEISLLSILLKLEKRFMNIQSQIGKSSIIYFQNAIQSIAFGNISVHDDFSDSEYAAEILSGQLGKEGGLFDILEKQALFSIEDPLVGKRTPENIIQSVSTLISELVGDENGESIDGEDLISRIPGYTNIQNIKQETYSNLSLEQKIFTSSLAQLERSLRIQIQMRLRVGDIRYRNNPNPDKITEEQFAVVYQNAVISGGNAVQKGIDYNFDKEGYLSREKLESLNLFDDETLDALDLYNDIKGNGPWYQVSDTTQSWMKVGLNIGKTVIGGMVLTLLTGGIATILGIGVRSVKLLKLGTTLRQSGTRLQMIDMGVNASIASWWIYPEGHDSLSEMVTNRSSDMVVGGFTAWLGYGLTKKFTQEGARLLSRGGTINTGVQAGDIAINGLAAEMGRQMAIQAIFTDKDLLDEESLQRDITDTPNIEIDGGNVNS